MGRAPGQRNPNFEAKRAALCRMMVPGLIEGGRAATLKSLAARAEVSVPTLRHYFDDREGVIMAVMAQAHQDYSDTFDADGVPEGMDVSASLNQYLTGFVQGWVHSPLNTLVLGSLTAGMESESLGLASLDHVIEPTLHLIERRLADHIARGELHSECDPRHGALMLFSPMLVALMHQHHLQGASYRPLDVQALLHDVVARFVTAHAP